MTKSLVRKSVVVTAVILAVTAVLIGFHSHTLYRADASTVPGTTTTLPGTTTTYAGLIGSPTTVPQPLTAPITQVAVPPVVAPVSAACQGSELSASNTFAGGFGAGFASGIYVITSTTPCSLSGFPLLQETNQSGALIPIDITDGIENLWSNPPAQVKVGPTTPVEFAVVSGGAVTTQSVSCSSEVPSALTLTFAGLNGTVSFSGQDPNLCGAVDVTPVIQGSNPAELNL
jgi:hypothetical protein